ncbi:hypothetical protein [Streptomyces carpinensis]|uniref:Uncharacterized protein n=1 Tax=Streptomyces carpinensis TaxID=66369 RepID=A0ABV1VVS3_9ACTN|nr:hypothetical protein [Streptomyces carpinensis]
MDYLETEDDVRRFLAMCLDPGGGRTTRTPVELTRLLQQPHLDAVERHAPQLATLRKDAEFRQQQADMARQMWADGLAAWIHGEKVSPAALADPEMPTGQDLTALVLQAGAAFTAAREHIDECDVCRPNMRLPELCVVGQDLALTAANAVTAPAPADAEPEPVDG